MSSVSRIRLPDGNERDALDIDFTVKNEEWNEYNLDDGTTVHLKTPVIRIFRLLDEGGEPSFTDEGEPEYLVLQDTAVSGPGTVQAALIGTAPEKTNGARGDALLSSESFGSAPSHAAGATPARMSSRPSFGGSYAEVSERPHGKARNLFLVWLIVTVRLVYSSLRHPGHPVWIDRRTGDVWLKRD